MSAATPSRKSDLGVRTASAVVMLAVAGAALWLGGWWWTAFVLVVGYGVVAEWYALSKRIARSWTGLFAWLAVALVYVGMAVYALFFLRNDPVIGSWIAVAIPVSAVVATDVGAYFAGRAIGGPKIAPKISPSKTWAGLAGGMATSALALVIWRYFDPAQAVDPFPIGTMALIGCAMAVIAQAGDFFESWMKRRAGVKDSGRLLPGHGGLFDRVDGLLAVMFVGAVVFFVANRGMGVP